MKTRPAFTLVELLVLIAIIAVFVIILVPAIASPISEARKAVCAVNLKTIARSFQQYTEDTTLGGFPRLAAKGNPNDVLKHGGTLDAATLGTNAMQNVWLLIDEGYLPTVAFKCPEDADHQRRMGRTKYGWENYNQFSYGMQNPYDADTDGDPVNKAVPVSTKTYKANYVFLADKNPGGPAAKKGHSNHRDGCNVAARGGRVWFHAKKSSSVVYGEDIYDDDGDPSDVWPDSATDVVITPTDPKGNRAKRAATKRAAIKQVTTKQATTKRAATKRAAIRQVTTKQATTKRAATKRAAIRQVTTKQAAVKRAVPKREASRQARTKQATGRQDTVARSPEGIGRIILMLGVLGVLVAVAMVILVSVGHRKRKSERP